MFTSVIDSIFLIKVAIRLFCTVEEIILMDEMASEEQHIDAEEIEEVPWTYTAIPTFAAGGGIVFTTHTLMTAFERCREVSKHDTLQKGNVSYKGESVKRVFRARVPLQTPTPEGLKTRGITSSQL
jgi:hypothetical protein